jgi:hypothetical protein
MDNKLFGRVIVACACTAALAGAACDNSSNQERSASSPAGSPAAAPADKSASEDQPITLTGCLMRGDGRNDFILTKANQPVGTSGEQSAAGSSIEQRQLEAAERSYRLKGDDEQFQNLVGHRVRVSGTLADKSDLSASSPSSDKSGSNVRGTSGEAQKNHEISESDLAKVDVKSIESVSDSCDGVNSKGASKPSRR